MSYLKTIVLCNGIKINHSYSNKTEKKSRCHMCIDECNGEEHKKKKHMLCRVKSCCMSCGKNTCSNHLVQECNDCFSAK